MAAKIVRRLMAANPTGPLFRNSRGLPWTKDSLRLAFVRLRNRIGVPNLCAYHFRHSYITRMLERGVDAATVAAISGNSPRMVLEIYNHVSRNEDRLRSVVRALRNVNT